MGVNRDFRLGDVVLQSDGRFLVMVRTWRRVAWLARYNANGSLDLSFGQAGATTLPRGTSLIALTQTTSGPMLAIAGSFTPSRRVTGNFYSTQSTAFVSRIVL
jgi:hypothetical protein